MNLRKILVAEDEAIIARVLRMQLQKLNFEVEVAANGSLALESVRKCQPDILITDIEMPVMTGEELCKQLAAEFPARQFPIFVSTSLTEVHHREWSQHIQNLYFIEKPLSVRKLTTLLKELQLLEPADAL